MAVQVPGITGVHMFHRGTVFAGVHRSTALVSFSSPAAAAAAVAQGSVVPATADWPEWPPRAIAFEAARAPRPQCVTPRDPRAHRARI